LLELQQGSADAMMLSFQRKLQDQPSDNADNARERQFFKQSLQYLLTRSGQPIEAKNWMVTSLEVEFGYQIGAGGLCV